MKKIDEYEQTLFETSIRLMEIAKDVSKLGGKYVSEYEANTIAHKADLGMHIILKEIGL